MCKDVRIDRVKLSDEEIGTWELGYYVRIFSNDLGGDTYGLKIDRSATGDSNASEEEETKILTTSYEKAEGWARYLAKERVEPVHLNEIAGELFVEAV